MDEPAFTCFGTVDAAGEVVRAKVAVGGGLGEHMPDDHDQGMGGSGCGLLATFFAEAAVKAMEALREEDMKVQALQDRFPASARIGELPLAEAAR